MSPIRDEAPPRTPGDALRAAAVLADDINPGLAQHLRDAAALADVLDGRLEAWERALKAREGIRAPSGLKATPAPS